MRPEPAAELLRAALGRRETLLGELDQTDCVRLLHGVVEGWPGVAVDRYGPVLLVQTWREPLEPGVLEALADVVAQQTTWTLEPVWNHRKGGGSPGAPSEAIGLEEGLRFDVRPRHRGQDPLLFLDFRVARRWVRQRGATSVLNLFSYTCGIGVAAAVGGAERVLNVDFAGSALQVGQHNAELNGVAMETLEENVFPAVRQLAGLDVGGRRGRRPRYVRLERESFELVVLDPPRWARTPWGAVDVVRDYPSLFKPALLAAEQTVLATNHVPKVELEAWLDILRRTAEKAERPLASIEVLEPDADFPSFDGRPPLKIAVCELQPVAR